ncbi:hypothetical protein Ahy_B03g068495 [Arachis hypogaea]|uniref:C2H2-type domain-containing protein n=1 Tax=Arachis hypogaea TaxID=3818 RepID=A0A445A9V6_ARAHY|nr:hypothetical protein Ahy_B03g068495 [Arachis hypogaea]
MMSEEPFSSVLPPNTTITSTLVHLQDPTSNPNPDAEVIAMSPKSLMATNRFRDQNLQLHRRGHNLPWKLKQRNKEEQVRKKVYVCPEKSCVHHDPCRALGDLTGIKKHYSRKHGEKKWKCDKCSKKYAVHSDWKAHAKICGTREYKCDCGTIFSRKDSFITHRAFCDALAEEGARISSVPTTLSNLMGRRDHNHHHHHHHHQLATSRIIPRHHILPSAGFHSEFGGGGGGYYSDQKLMMMRNNNINNNNNIQIPLWLDQGNSNNNHNHVSGISSNTSSACTNGNTIIMPHHDVVNNSMFGSQQWQQNPEASSSSLTNNNNNANVAMMMPPPHAGLKQEQDDMFYFGASNYHHHHHIMLQKASQIGGGDELVNLEGSISSSNMIIPPLILNPRRPSKNDNKDEDDELGLTRDFLGVGEDESTMSNTRPLMLQQHLADFTAMDMHHQTHYSSSSGHYC